MTILVALKRYSRQVTLALLVFLVAMLPALLVDPRAFAVSYVQRHLAGNPDLEARLRQDASDAASLRVTLKPELATVALKAVDDLLSPTAKAILNTTEKIFPGATLALGRVRQLLVILDGAGVALQNVEAALPVAEEIERLRRSPETLSAADLDVLANRLDRAIEGLRAGQTALGSIAQAGRLLFDLTNLSAFEQSLRAINWGPITAIADALARVMALPGTLDTRAGEMGVDARTLASLRTVCRNCATLSVLRETTGVAALAGWTRKNIVILLGLVLVSASVWVGSTLGLRTPPARPGVPTLLICEQNGAVRRLPLPDSLAVNLGNPPLAVIRRARVNHYVEILRGSGVRLNGDYVCGARPLHRGDVLQTPKQTVILS